MKLPPLSPPVGRQRVHRAMDVSRGGVLAALAVVALVLMAAATAPAAHAQGSRQVRAQIGQAYAAVLSAEREGGNVTSLVVKLNSALALVEQADLVNTTNPSRAQSLYSQAAALASQVLQGAPAVGSAGASAVAASQLDLAAETAALAALAVVVYVYAPRIFWRLWLRTHRDWKVKKA